MKTIGLIGGMSWESTIPYYGIINEYIREKLGGLHSAKIMLYSVDFDEIEKCQSSGDWERSGEILADAARRLELGGADLILICTNTMHKVFAQVQSTVRVPILHIAEATAAEIKKEHIKTVALLGTKYTMTQEFYKEKLKESGFDVLIPDEDDIETVNRVIFQELCVGSFKDESRKEFSRIIAQLKERGAEAVIFGCTEIGLLLQQKDSVLKIFDTTQIHAKAAAQIALEADN